jgi:hypothetical protein
VTSALSGYELLGKPQLNRGTAFSENEHAAFDHYGLLPSNVLMLDEQVLRPLQALRDFETDLERLRPPAGFQDDNETCSALRTSRRKPGRVFADRLHAHRRRELPAIQPPV